MEQLKGKIAIVLDDWGYHANSPDTLNAKLYPLTAAVIPNLNHTRSVIKQLHENGYEIILHLPMQPNELMNLEPNTITVDLNEGEIKRIVDQDLTEISYAKGINNHMGSQATSDLRTMVPIFKELRRNHLYFLDSFTSSDSVCEDLAQKLKVAFVKRDVFIDNESDPEYIRGQIAKLKSLASVRGWAIGIGHDRKNTLEVLREELPKIRNEGYELVYVSELAQ
ncbi:MAG: divergent polysaccharide deacetylase family protein [Candidatus Omnitrophica bacterium]|nr:divergent polysaccharide deacetylase family protein [Candidatus Omnitrophota bacterium]